MRKPLTLLFSLLLLAFSSCSTFWEKPIYKIGIDPDFYSIELDGMESDVFTYCNELFKIIGKEEGMNIAFVKTSWDILEQGLKQKKYHAIITGSPKYLAEKDKYDHSSLFLSTGTDLVVEKELNASGLVDLKGKIVAIVSGSKTDLLLQGYPDITMRTYPSMATALNSITEGYSDAALIPNLFAQQYINNIYPTTLRIVGSPLTDAGLRLITHHQENQDLLNFVDNALSMLRENGKLKALQKKWALTY